MNRTRLQSLISAVLVLAWVTGTVSGQPELPSRPAPPPPMKPLLVPPDPARPKVVHVDADDEPAVNRAAEVVVSPGRGDVSTGRQEPGVSLEWIGPETVRLGQPTHCQLVVKNISAAAVHGVVVRNRVPPGVVVKAAEPRAGGEGPVLEWELGTLQPGQERRIRLHLLPEKKGDLECQASVTFTGTSIARLKVREPKLALKAALPERIMIGEPATFALTISNPGDCLVEGVKVKTTLPPGLEHARGNLIEFEVGNLASNESRSIQLVCATKAGGAQKCEALASAEGNLTAQDAATVEVILPKLDLSVDGPKLRYLDRPATYVIQVTNAGTAPVQNVTLSDLLPAGFKFVSATAGGRLDPATKAVSWFVGDLTPGQSLEVSLTTVAALPGEHRHQVTALAARGLRSESEAVTRVEGLSALLMELVDVDDPVEVGVDTCYEIRVTNTGSKTETNLQLICTLPDKMEFRGAKAAGGVPHRVQGKEVVFEPLPRLAPRADVVFRVTVRGAAPGDLRFRARITADGLTDPVLKEESTKVYGE